MKTGITFSTSAIVLLMACAVGFAAPPVKKGTKEQLPEDGFGLYARIDTILGPTSFETTQYRAKDLTLHTWKSGNVRVEGADTSKLVNGEYFHAWVKDVGIYKDPSTKSQWRRYQIVRVFEHR